MNPPVESLSWDDDRHDDRLHEECGIFSVFGSEDASILTALGLHALQHRGQEGCGIATFDGHRFHTERHLGLVGDNLTGEDLPKRLPGFAAIGHTRYATQGGTLIRNVQPLFADLSTGGFAIGHNGNLTNARALREELVEHGAIFQSTSDTEVILQLIARSRRHGVIERFTDALRQIEGAYALVCITNDMVIGARDPARHSSACPRRSGRRGDPGFRNLRARHDRRTLRAQHRKWRSGCHHARTGRQGAR